MTREQAQSAALDAGRRRFTRLQVAGDFSVHDTTLDLTMELEDVSFGGMRTRTPIPLLPGQSHRFEVCVPSLGPLTLFGRVVHCRSASDSESVHTVGWSWSSDVLTARSITTLMTHLTSDTARTPSPAGSPDSITH